MIWLFLGAKDQKLRDSTWNRTGLPEDQLKIRIRSDDRYTIEPWVTWVGESRGSLIPPLSV